MPMPRVLWGGPRGVGGFLAMYRVHSVEGPQLATGGVRGLPTPDMPGGCEDYVDRIGRTEQGLVLMSGGFL